MARWKRGALEVADGVVRAYPNDPRSLDALAVFHYSFGNATEAIASWQRCLKLDHRFIGAYLGIGSSLMRSGDHRQAAALAREMLRAYPQSVDAYNLLANALLEMGDTEEAIETLKSSLQLDSRFPPTHYMIGKAYLKVKRFDEAKQHYQAAIEADPDYVQAYYGLGTAFAKLQEKEKSEQSFEKFKQLRHRLDEVQTQKLQVEDAVSVPRKVAVICTLAGTVYASHGNLRKAEEIWHQGASLDAANVECRRALATLYQQQARPRQAVQMLQQLTEIKPDNPKVFLALGALHDGLAQFEEAERAFRRVCELAPSAPNYFALGEACQRNGDRAAASAALEEAMRLDSANASYRQLYDQIQQDLATGKPGR